MKNILKLILYFPVFCWFFNVSGVRAQVMTLKKGMYDESSRPFARVWADKSMEMTYETAIAGLKNGEFKPLDSLNLPGAFRRGAYVYWIAIIARNPSPETFPLLLYSIRLSEDSTWQLRGNLPPEIKKISRFGEKEPNGIIPYPLRWGWIYPVRPQATDTILIKYYNFKPIPDFLPRASDAVFYSAKDLEVRLRDNWIFIFGFGALFSVFVFAFSLWVYTRQTVFFWYAAFCFSLLITTFWNFDVEVPPLYFISNFVEWANTKMYIQTLLPAICHSLFLYYFFGDQSLLLKKLVRIFLWACAFAAAIETILLLTDQLRYSWIFYWFFRNLILVYGLLAVYFIRNIPGKQAKWVIVGALSIYIFDALSNFSIQYTSYITLAGLMVDIFCFTVAAASRFNQIQREKLHLIMEHQTFEMEQKLEMERMKNKISRDLRNEIASDLHDDLGSVLSGIALSADYLKKTVKTDSDDMTQLLDYIDKDATKSLSIIRDTVWAMNPEKETLYGLIEKFHPYVVQMCNTKGIVLDFKSNPAEADLVKIDMSQRKNLYLCLKEIVNNAVRHSECTHIKCRMEQEKDGFKVYVEDNGVGIHAEKAALGNGLANIRNRMKESLFELEFNSSSSGTSYTIKIPTLFGG